MQLPTLSFCWDALECQVCLRQVPSGLLPAMELDGRLVIESDDIMAALEAEFPDKRPLMPPRGTPQRQRAEGLLRLERRLFSDWLRWLTSSWCVAA